MPAADFTTEKRRIRCEPKRRPYWRLPCARQKTGAPGINPFDLRIDVGTAHMARLQCYAAQAVRPRLELRCARPIVKLFTARSSHGAALQRKT
jgi:hypothetical protein